MPGQHTGKVHYMKRTCFALFLLIANTHFLLAQASAQQATAEGLPTAQVEQEIRHIAQELLDAVAPGDKAVWERHLTENCLFTDEEGNTLTKRQLLDQLRPLPAGYRGTIRIAEARVRAHGDVAVIQHRDLERLELYGQVLNTEFRATDTYLRRDGRWQLIASQVMVVPSERRATSVKSNIYDSYVGQYELAPGVVYTVRREGDRLIGQRTGREPEELLPYGENIFFRRGTWRGEKIFVRDANGRVAQMLDRRDNNDLVWRRRQ